MREIKELDLYIFDDLYLGKLFFEYNGGKEIISFEFCDEFLCKNISNFFIDPSINLYKGRQFKNDYGVFNFIKDMLPDRWGKSLIKRKLLLNKNDNKKVIYINNEPSVYDYLTNLSDYLRSGALRIKSNDVFLDDSFNVPPLINIKTIEKEAVKFDYDKKINEDNLSLLISPASSLGGARPKSNAINEKDNQLWIVKFPSKNDDYDKEKIEAALYFLASKIEINVYPFSLIKLSKYGSSFLTKRFDRKENNKRIHYFSAFTLLNANDGESEYYSYLSLVSLIKEFSFKSKEDLKELYKRMIFNYLMSNTDDHLRNFGFLMDEDFKIYLSPFFDLSSIYSKEKIHSLSIDESFNNGNNLKLDNFINISKYFDINKDEALTIIKFIVNTIKDNLSLVFKKYKFNNSEKEYLLSTINYEMFR